MAKAYLILGGNIDNRKHYIDSAVQLIQSHAGEVTETSSVYETSPWGFKNENWFLNLVIAVKTPLNPSDLFHVIVNIENSLGRKRNNRKYTSRTIDIDILFYENEVMFSETLVIPHPRIRERKFVLEPLNELIPQYIHPVEKKTIRQLFLECNDQLEVKRFGNNQSYLSPKAKSPASPIPGTI